jgi:hypothetical protein
MHFQRHASIMHTMLAYATYFLQMPTSCCYMLAYMEDASMAEMSGKARGGHARMEGVSKKDRKALAKKAAAARWSEDIKQATHGSDDHPLKIGEIEIPCYIVDGEQRVLSLGGMVRALGMSIGSAAGRQGDRLYQFATGKNILPFVSSDLISRMSNPIRFRAPTGGSVATGYDATILPEICDAVLAARDAKALRADQLHIAKQCEILVRGLARVGIIALVDEATGFQRDRTANALAKILEAFIAKELQRWVQTFPPEYYEQIFRLRGMEYPKDTLQRPRYFGVLTNDIVYDRLAPGVLDELKKANPKDEATGRRKSKHFQWLTNNIGYPKLREHLGAVIATMKLSTDWHDFKAKLDNNYPRIGKPTQLSFEYVEEEDSGKGL